MSEVRDKWQASMTSIRVSGDVHRRLLQIQHERKMAGESLSFSEIIGELLEKAEAT